MAVPLFFTISGALLLNRPEEPLTRLWGRRVVRYAVLLVGACSLYYVQANGFDLTQCHIKEWIIVLYSYSSGGITWFLYSYLAYLILLPVLSTLAKNLKNIYFQYLFAIALIYNGLIPVLEYAVFQGSQTINPSLAVDWATKNIVLYPLLGYYLEHRVKSKPQGKHLAGLWAANILAVTVSCAMTAYQGRIQGAYIENESSTFFGCFVLINCCTLYLTFDRIAQKVNFPEWSRRIICFAGQCTLGIYVFHMFIMKTRVCAGLRAAIVGTGMNPMAASMVFCLFVMAVCLGITAVFKKIPGIRNLL